MSLTQNIKTYASLVTFNHTLFALPFAMIGYFLAAIRDGYGFDLRLLGLVILCMVFARNAAMSFNRYIDRNIDEANPRTHARDIPAGRVKASSALIFAILNALLFVAASWFINPLCFYLSPVALLVTLGYSLTKRFSSSSHLVLGLGLSLAPIGSYIAVSGEFRLLPVMFSACVVFWVSGFDIIYALQDESYDRDNKLHSLPVLLGIRNALRLSSLFHVISFLFVVAAGVVWNFGYLYWIGCAIFSTLLITQHRLVKPDDLSKLNFAFFTTNGIASLLFSACVIADLFLHP
ncbi:MAG: UbiA-like polyprenyltransferase [Bacteroidota bacterium]